ncbi:dicarboxylate/amino acid:cation symporter [uncultured Methanobrevibacter sp.]|uniref:dicarboxylate/amino acid:cation symporter n=1 Tax=uncultured Methanobrevibacter sp. TaxID=253161 RepID=UPI0025D6BA4C|nr:dicarboxylate/amino acid:cation symporter [uncultured Methanobrevibacter sp.]
MTDLVLNIIPENPLNALANSEMLSVIILGAIMGFILIKLSQKTPTLNNVFKESKNVMIAMTGVILKIAPFGVFCLMARTFGTLGFESVFPLAKFIDCVILGLVIQLFIVYPFILVIFTKVNHLRFYRKFMSVMFFAFSTLSSNATIPLNMNKLEDIGISRDISSFTVPLGATINKNGTIIMQSVTAMFAAQYCGIDLGTSAIITLIITVIIASTSTPTVPMASVFTLSMILSMVGLPIAIIDLITGIYNIIGMFNALSNITGKGICTSIVAHQYKSFDMDTFNERET